MDKTIRLKQETYNRLAEQSKRFETADETLSRVLTSMEAGTTAEAIQIVLAMQNVTNLSYPVYEDHEEDSTEYTLKTLSTIVKEIESEKNRLAELLNKFKAKVRNDIPKETLVVKNTSEQIFKESNFQGDVIIIDCSNVLIANNLIHGYILSGETNNSNNLTSIPE